MQRELAIMYAYVDRGIAAHLNGDICLDVSPEVRPRVAHASFCEPANVDTLENAIGTAGHDIWVEVCKAPVNGARHLSSE